MDNVLAALFIIVPAALPIIALVVLFIVIKAALKGKPTELRDWATEPLTERLDSLRAETARQEAREHPVSQEDVDLPDWKALEIANDKTPSEDEYDKAVENLWKEVNES
jgi:hypothetical protein